MRLLCSYQTLSAVCTRLVVARGSISETLKPVTVVDRLTGADFRSEQHSLGAVFLPRFPTSAAYAIGPRMRQRLIAKIRGHSAASLRPTIR